MQQPGRLSVKECSESHHASHRSRGLPVYVLCLGLGLLSISRLCRPHEVSSPRTCSPGINLPMVIPLLISSSDLQAFKDRSPVYSVGDYASFNSK